MDTYEYLNLAADYMDEHGWTQGNYRDDHGVCLIGAVMFSRPDCHPVESTWAEGVIDEYLKANESVPEDIKMSATVTFNDTICKSKEQAVAVLRNAAESVKPVIIPEPEDIVPEAVDNRELVTA